MKETEVIDQVLKERVRSRLPVPWLKEHGIVQGYMAGNSLNRSSPNDIDLFPIEKDAFKAIRNLGKENGLISRTKNADTFLLRSGEVVQFCNYYHPSLEELVRSFDFAHIQVGAKFLITEVGGLDVVDVYYTPEWINAHAVESTWYTGSEYPLSSLIRLVKYASRDTFPGRSYIRSVLEIVVDIVKRGFVGYEDFKNQLDAVDLGLLDKEIQEVQRSKLMELFLVLDKSKSDGEEAR
jgi:hypothetical protein